MEAAATTMAAVPVVDAPCRLDPKDLLKVTETVIVISAETFAMTVFEWKDVQMTAVEEQQRLTIADGMIEEWMTED